MLPICDYLLNNLIVFAAVIFRAIIGPVSIVRSGLSKGHE
jgi:hypothetical protein